MKVSRDKALEIIARDIKDTEGMSDIDRADFILSSIESRLGIVVSWDSAHSEYIRLSLIDKNKLRG